MIVLVMEAMPLGVSPSWLKKTFPESASMAYPALALTEKSSAARAEIPMRLWKKVPGRPKQRGIFSFYSLVGSFTSINHKSLAKS